MSEKTARQIRKDINKLKNELKKDAYKEILSEILSMSFFKRLRFVFSVKKILEELNEY